MIANPLPALLGQAYEAMYDSSLVAAYHASHGTRTACNQTIVTDDSAADVTAYLRPRIEGRVVVEIGAGIGLLACHLARVARRVYAIEVDPLWTSIFVLALYARKPPNLTFICGKAEEAPPIAADVALFCTLTGQEALTQAAARFAPVVIDVYAEVLHGMT